MKPLGEITTHSETAESFSTRFTNHSETMKNKGTNLTKATSFSYSSGRSCNDLGSTLSKFVSAVGKVSSSIQNDAENILKINQTFIEKDKENEKRFD